MIPAPRSKQATLGIRSWCDGLAQLKVSVLMINKSSEQVSRIRGTEIIHAGFQSENAILTAIRQSSRRGRHTDSLDCHPEYSVA